MNLYIDWVKYLCLKKLVGPVNLSILILIFISVESKLTCQTPRGYYNTVLNVQVYDTLK